MDKRVLHNVGPAADRQRRRLPRRLLRVGHRQGLPRLVEHHRDQGRAAVAGLGPRAALPHRSASTTASSGRGPSTRAATAGSPRCWPGPRSRSARRSCSSRRSTHVITKDGRATGVALADGTEYQRHDRRQRARPAADVPRAGRSARAADRPRRDHPPLPVPGHVGQGQLRPRRPPDVPGARRSRRPVPRASPTSGRRWTTSSAPSTRPSTAGTARGRTSTAPSSRRSTPTWRPPGKHVWSSLRPVRAVPAARERLGHRAPEPRRHRPAHDRVVLPRLRQTSSCTARSSPRSTSSGRSGSPRATSSPASSWRRRCTSSARRPAGASTAPRSTATTSAARAPIPAAASWAPRASSAAQRILEGPRAGLATVDGAAPGKEEPRAVGPGVQVKAIGCGGRIRTDDLRVMSPTSCRCSTPPAYGSTRSDPWPVPNVPESRRYRPSRRPPITNPATRLAVITALNTYSGYRMSTPARTPATSDATMNPTVPAAPNRPCAVDDRPAGEFAATTA